MSEKGNRNAALLSRLTPWAILLVTVWVSVNTSLSKDYKTGILETDAKGYYAYLPAIFIYHDLNFGFYDRIENQLYANPNSSCEYIREHNGRKINKYYAGTALCELPFFMAGHLITLMTGYSADGYSYYYTMMVHAGALIYLLAGLLGLRRLLSGYGFGEGIISFVLFGIVFGTNLFYYSVTEFGMSHVYSFALITWFCVKVRDFYRGEHPGRSLYMAALLLGLITLIRPLNLMIVLAVPFLSGSAASLQAGFNSLLGNKKRLITAFLLSAGIMSIQLFLYKVQTGSFLVYSYKEEGFQFQNAHFVDFLFSYRKGMFLYTPLLLLCTTGFLYIFRRNRFEFYTLAGFLLLLVYIFSSWHMWYYGGSFSQRVMIDYYALFAILLGSALTGIAKFRVRFLFSGAILVLVILCQIQTYQYRYNQIHWSDMNREKYWDVFLRPDKI
jgi:hypothetical protein